MKQLRLPRIPRFALLLPVAGSLLLAGWLWQRLDSFQAFAEPLPGEILTFHRMAKGKPTIDSWALPGSGLRFEKQEWIRAEPIPTIHAAGPDQAFRSHEPKEGVRGRIPGSTLGFVVERFIPDAVENAGLQEDPKAPEDPCMRVVLGLGLQEPLVGHLFAHHPSAHRREEPGGRFAVVFRDNLDAPLLATLRPCPPRSEKVVMSWKGRLFSREVKLGEVWNAGGFLLRVTQAFPDFAIRKDAKGHPEAFTRSRSPRDPWIQLDFQGPGQEPRRVLLSALNPEDTDRINAENLPQGLGLRYVREGEERQRRFVLFTRVDRKVRLLEEGRVVREEPMELNAPFLVEPGISVVPVALMDRVPYFVPNPEAVTSARPRRPVVRIRVEDPGKGGGETFWLDALAGGEEARRTTFGGGASFFFGPADSELRVHLTILDDQGKALSTRQTTQDAPLSIRGYRLLPRLNRTGPTDALQIIAERDADIRMLVAGLVLLAAGPLWLLSRYLAQRRMEAP